MYTNTLSIYIIIRVKQTNNVTNIEKFEIGIKIENCIKIEKIRTIA